MRIDHLDLLGWRGRATSLPTILIVAVPEDEEVAATYFGAGAEMEGNRPRLSIEGDPAK